METTNNIRHQRDYLLPSPCANYRELRYDTAFVCSAGSTLGLVVVSRPRVFSTSRSNIFGRHLLGGWSAEGSERYNRLAKLKIAQVQRSVIKIIWDKDSWDPLSESSLLRELTDSWRAHQIDKSEITQSIRLLSSRRYSEAVRPPSTELLPVDTQLEEYLEIDEDLAEGSRGGETRQAKATSLEYGKDEKARRESEGLSQSCGLLFNQVSPFPHHPRKGAGPYTGWDSVI